MVILKQLASFALFSALFAGVSATAKTDLEEIHASFVKRANANNGVIKLNAQDFEAITASNREWNVAVHLTALGSEFKCEPCKKFDPSFKAVAQAWWKKAPKAQKNSQLFASLDFSDGQAIFRKLGLSSAPVLQFYPAAQGPLKPTNGRTSMWNYDFNAHAFDAAALAEELSRSTPSPIPYRAPPNYALIFTALSTGAAVLVGALFFWRYFSSFVLSRWTWAFVSILSSLIFTGGYMFVRIRAMPFAHVTREGAQWVAGGYQNQYGAETYVISTLYGTLALAQIALILLVPRILKPTQQRAAIYIWSGVTILLYSVLMSLFRMKNGGYPFRLLF